MLYLLIAAGVFALDFGIKHYIDKKYRIKEQHPCPKNKIILEKYYNDGAALGFLAKKPGLMRAIHTAMIVMAGIFFYILLRTPGKNLAKTGMALLLGGGANNLYDRYAKGHVVDYFRINMGPKRLRRIIFNISDFCIFIGVLLAAVGAEKRGL
ncbi:MAG: signal peptidase II [Roseburia sp.]|nr:signal peptidase II [Roseburia sp.]